MTCFAVGDVARGLSILIPPKKENETSGKKMETVSTVDYPFGERKIYVYLILKYAPVNPRLVGLG